MMLILYMGIVSGVFAQDRAAKLIVTGTDSVYMVPFSPAEIKRLRIKIIESEQCVQEGDTLRAMLGTYKDVVVAYEKSNENLVRDYKACKTQQAADSHTLNTFERTVTGLVKDKKELGEQVGKLNKTVNRWQNTSIVLGTGFAVSGVLVFFLLR